MSNQSDPILPLCNVCQTLDLSETNNREEAKYSLGTWEDVARKAMTYPYCPFCTLMRVFARLHPGWYDSGEASTQWKAKGGFFFRTDGDILAFIDEGTAESPNGFARKIQSHIDPALITKWMKLCDVHHEETCTPKRDIIKTLEGDTGVKVLRVIDTEDQCIVEAVAGVRYLALSYVWGQVVPSVRLQRNNVAELSAKGALLSLRQSFPKTINDAIDLVQLIGERYLWIDSLCLIQDDNDDMLDGISHMDLVYQCATLTIIAAHGVDANAGLPGVHPGSRRVDQVIREVLPGIKMTATTGVYNAMRGVHTTRGWTMQELVLSHRTLIFTKNCIYFRCRANCWSEDTIYDKFPSVSNEILHSGGLIEFMSDSEPRPLPAYNQQLFRYADRKLTKESDTIHGLTGILRFLSVHAKSGVLEGLFTNCLDISILFWDNFPGTTTPGRRGGFPSWSWAGWHAVRDGYGRFCKSSEDVNSWLNTMTYIVWYKRSPGTTKLSLVWDLDSELKHGKLEEHNIGYRPNSEDPYGRSIDESLKDLRTVPDEEDPHSAEIIRKEMNKRNYHFLHFFAHVVLVQFEEFPARERMHKILGTGGVTCGLVRFDDPELMKNVQGPHELVLLSKMNRFDDFFNNKLTLEFPFYWVILIVWQGERQVVAERRGIGFLFQECLPRVLHPGKVWKEIVLA